MLFFGAVMATKVLEADPATNQDDARDKRASISQMTATTVTIVVIAIAAVWAAWPPVIPEYLEFCLENRGQPIGKDAQLYYPAPNESPSEM